MKFSISNISLFQNISRIFWSPQMVDLYYRLVVIVLYLIALWLFFVIVSSLIRFIRHLKEPYVFLEITPPVDTKIQNVSNSQLFNLIMGLLEQRSWRDRLTFRQISASFEIISRKETGIQFIIRTPKSYASTFEKTLRAYSPDLKIKQIKEYIPQTIPKNVKVLEFGLQKHFCLPLNEQDDLNKHDPLAYLTSNMSRLKDDELLALQVVLKPLVHSNKNGLKHETSRLRKVLHRNTHIDWSQNTQAQRTANVFVQVLEFVTHVIMIPILFLAEFVSGNEAKFPITHTKFEPSPSDIELSELSKTKLSSPLFETSIRTLLIVSKDQMSEREKGLRSSFMSYRHSCGQTLAVRRNYFGTISQRIKLWKLRNRVGGSLVLSSSEIGALYHFPFNTDVHSEDLSRVRSRELPVPLSFKKENPDLDVIFGVNDYAGNETAIGTTLDQRRKHTYIIGKTGTGKTTLLKSAIYQDMVNGKGLAVFDPHGDMFHELLEIVPENRRQDVVVFDPSDRGWPIGLNILSPGVKFLDKEDGEEWITSSVIGVFAKITAKEYWGPRMEHILRNATLTALQTENPSLYTLQKLLTDKSFQKKTAQSLKDPVLKQFWNKEFALLGKMQLSSVTAPLTQRLGLFITTKMSRHILLQEKSTISISQIMDEGKILLVNLAKGDLGEDQSFFFGTILTSIIWMAAYQRTKIAENKRRDFFLYVDEFQNFATPRFSEITSEGRKFRIGLIASHQNIAQVDDQKILQIVAGNANTIICLKASPDDEKFILPFMEPEVEPGDIVNLAPYHFYMKVSNEASENAFSGVTVPLGIKASEEVKKAVLAYSRKKYATSREQVEEYLDELLSGKTHAAKSSLKKPSKQKQINFPTAEKNNIKKKKGA